MLEDPAPKVFAQRGVELADGLVEQQQTGLGKQGAQQGDAGCWHAAESRCNGRHQRHDGKKKAARHCGAPRGLRPLEHPKESGKATFP
jgi:Rod binding domain-containing protein